MPPAPAALSAIADRLRCPACGAGLAADGGTLRCARGHAYDVARGGFVSLVPSSGRVPAGDTAAMIAARAAFLDAGHYAPISRALADAARAVAGRRDAVLVAELGAGTAHHLTVVLDALPDAAGVALDVSRPALRQAGRRHERIAAVRCDVWRGLPLRDGAADVVLDVFAPRNGAEIARVLAPDGALLVVTPLPDHLAELRDALGLLDVDPAKRARLRAELAGLGAVDERDLRFTLALDRDETAALAAMGPAAHHVPAAELTRRAAALPEPVAVTAAVRLSVFAR